MAKENKADFSMVGFDLLQLSNVISEKYADDDLLSGYLISCHRAAYLCYAFSAAQTAAQQVLSYVANDVETVEEVLVDGK